MQKCDKRCTDNCKEDDKQDWFGEWTLILACFKQLALGDVSALLNIFRKLIEQQISINILDALVRER